MHGVLSVQGGGGERRDLKAGQAHVQKSLVSCERVGFSPTEGISSLLKDVNPGSEHDRSLILEAPSSCQPGG